MGISYGSAPRDLGLIDVCSPEMKYYLYLPVMIPGSDLQVPKRLGSLGPLLDRVIESEETRGKYVYITAKTMFVSQGCSGNRPGWHADGYGSGGDINFIWYDMNPTEFAVHPFFSIPEDDTESMKAFESQAICTATFPVKHLLRLDESVIHRTSPLTTPGVRTFVKITVSEHRFARLGNSHNYELDYDWKLTDRSNERNIDHG